MIKEAWRHGRDVYISWGNGGVLLGKFETTAMAEKVLIAIYNELNKYES